MTDAIQSLDEPMVQPQQLRLIASDKTTSFLVTPQQASISEYLTTALARSQPSVEIIDVELAKIDALDLEKLVSFMRHHDGKDCPKIPMPLRSKVLVDVVEDPWDAQFADALVKPHLASVLLAANYLGMQGLVYLCAAKIGSFLKGIPLEQIRGVAQQHLGTATGSQSTST